MSRVNFLAHSVWAGFLACLLLAGCADGGPTPPPAPPYIPPPVTAPSFVAKFDRPTMHVAGYCEEQTPVPCDVPEGALWASFNRPGNAGIGCADPNPNDCYSVSAGVLVTRADDPGFPLTTAQSFDPTKTIVMRAEVSAEIADPSGFCGIVNYGGERAYEAIYWQKVKDGLQVHLFRTRVEVPLSADVYPAGSRHWFEIEAHPDGTVNYKIDGAVKLTETPTNLIGPDTTLFNTSMHGSIFAGYCAMAVYSFTVTEVP